VTEVREHRFEATESSGEVSAVFMRPRGAHALYVFAHGAGAAMRHVFMESVAERLAAAGVATLRFNFPYMERGRGGPDPAPILVKTVRSAVAEAARLGPRLPLFAGGKSMGGRMTSTAAASGLLPGVLGLAFFGFPLHAPGKPCADRGAHLTDVGLPMLFLQGTRDKLADLGLLRPLLRSVKPEPTLHVVDEADHGFHVPKRSGLTDAVVLDQVCAAFAAWVDDRLRG
jgi:predicted alpha/beta-hydrolase family hydrolase